MIAKEYLKMADVFVGDVIAGDDDLIRDEDGLIGDMQWPKDCAEYAAHAINSHDELVAENEGLRELIIRIGMYFEVSGWRAEKESDNLIRQWLYDSIAFMYGGES